MGCSTGGGAESAHQKLCKCRADWL